MKNVKSFVAENIVSTFSRYNAKISVCYILVGNRFCFVLVSMIFLHLANLSDLAALDIG